MLGCTAGDTEGIGSIPQGRRGIESSRVSEQRDDCQPSPLNPPRLSIPIESKISHTQRESLIVISFSIEFAIFAHRCSSSLSMNRFHRSDVLVDDEDRGKRKGRRKRRNNGVDHRAIPTHHNSCSTVISAEPLGFPLFFHPPPPSHRRSKSPGFIIAFLSSFSSNFLKDFSFQLLSILYQYRYTRRAFRLKCILDASQFGKRERTLGFDENFPRRLPFEIASECTKFPP